MDNELKKVKAWLMQANRTEFYRAINEAKLVDLERKVLKGKFIRGRTNIEIAMRLYISESYVNKLLRRAYMQLKPFIEGTS